MVARLYIGLLAVAFVFLIWFMCFTGGDDDTPPVPVKPKLNLCQQKEEINGFDKAYLVANNLTKLHIDDDYTDIEIITQNVTMRAHKIILASHSQYFSTLIWETQTKSDHNNVKNNITRLNIKQAHLDPKTLSTIFNYIYYTILPNNVINNATEYSNLLMAATEFQMESLKCELSRLLSNGMNVHRVGPLVALAEETGTRYLMITATKYLLDNLKEVGKTSEWKTVIKDHKNILTNAIDFNGKLQDNSICDIQCIPADLTSPSVVMSLREMYLEHRFADAEIHVSDNGEDKLYQVNRAVLMGQSVLFRLAFDASPKSIQVRNTTGEVMDEFLFYMYTGWTTQKFKRMCNGLLYLSGVYDMKGLQDACENILIDTLKVENAADLIILADQSNSKRLLSIVLEFILKHHKEVVKTKAWTELKTNHPDILTKIFSN